MWRNVREPSFNTAILSLSGLGRPSPLVRAPHLLPWLLSLSSFKSLLFREVLGLQQSRGTEFPTHAQSSLPDGVFVTVDEPTQTCHNHPKPIVHTRICSGCCIFYGFGLTYMTWIQHCTTIQSSYTPLKILCEPLVHPPCSSTPDNH